MPATHDLPGNIHCARDYEALAREVLDPAVFAHLAGGAGRDRAAVANIAAFDGLTIMPRVLRDLTAGTTLCRVGGQGRPHPIWLAPVAFQLDHLQPLAPGQPLADLEPGGSGGAVDEDRGGHGGSPWPLR